MTGSTTGSPGTIYSDTPSIRPAAGLTVWKIRVGSFLVPLAHAAGQNVVPVFGLRFLTDSLAITAGVAGLIFALVKIYDGLSDPAGHEDRAETIGL